MQSDLSHWNDCCQLPRGFLSVALFLGAEYYTRCKLQYEPTVCTSWDGVDGTAVGGISAWNYHGWCNQLENVEFRYLLKIHILARVFQGHQEIQSLSMYAQFPGCLPVNCTSVFMFLTASEVFALFYNFSFTNSRYRFRFETGLVYWMACLQSSDL